MLNWNRRSLLAGLLAASMVAAAPAARAEKDAEHDEEGESVTEEREREYYENGQEALDEGQWEESAKWFGKAAKIGGPRGAGAYYWTAYSLNKLGRRSEAMEILETLKTQYPESRWKNDARALEVEIRGKGAKVAPDKGDNEETKLYALQALANIDDPRAVPMLIKFLDGPHSQKLKEQALYVLVQSGTPEAGEKVIAIAKGASNPHLQRKALEYLAVFDDGEQTHRILKEVYASTTDPDIKRAIIQGFIVSDDVEGMYEIARNEKDLNLRREAIHGLGVQGASEELMQLYRSGPPADARKAIIEAIAIADHPELLKELALKETNPDTRRRAIHGLGQMDSEDTGEDLKFIYKQFADPDTREAVVQAFMMQSNAKAILEVLNTEQNPDVRRAAIHALGAMDEDETGDALVAIYRKFSDRETRRAVMDAFVMQDNAQALIAIAREEKDPELRRQAIERLASVDSDEATSFLLKILEED